MGEVWAGGRANVILSQCSGTQVYILIYIHIITIIYVGQHVEEHNITGYMTYHELTYFCIFLWYRGTT